MGSGRALRAPPARASPARGGTSPGPQPVARGTGAVEELLPSEEEDEVEVLVDEGLEGEGGGSI